MMQPIRPFKAKRLGPEDLTHATNQHERRRIRRALVTKGWRRLMFIFACALVEWTTMTRFGLLAGLLTVLLSCVVFVTLYGLMDF